MIELKYDKKLWTERVAVPVKTLQVFITGECNARCRTCFFRKHLGDGSMSIVEYRRLVKKHAPNIEKVILIGGEPTLHPSLPEMVHWNALCGLKTTIYTNGANMNTLEKCLLHNPSIRLSVGGKCSRWKSLDHLKAMKALDVPYMLVLTLDQHNKDELFDVAETAKYDLGCKSMYITSIRDIVVSGNYWLDTEDTIPLYEYAQLIQRFVDRWIEPMEFHISRRGILTTGYPEHQTCRYLNILPNGEAIRCPWDISLDKCLHVAEFADRACVQNPEGKCILQKIVLTHK